MLFSTILLVCILSSLAIPPEPKRLGPFKKLRQFARGRQSAGASTSIEHEPGTSGSGVQPNVPNPRFIGRPKVAPPVPPPNVPGISDTRSPSEARRRGPLKRFRQWFSRRGRPRQPATSSSIHQHEHATSGTEAQPNVPNSRTVGRFKVSPALPQAIPTDGAAAIPSSRIPTGQEEAYLDTSVEPEPGTSGTGSHNAVLDERPRIKSSGRPKEPPPPPPSIYVPIPGHPNVPPPPPPSIYVPIPGHPNVPPPPPPSIYVPIPGHPNVPPPPPNYVPIPGHPNVPPPPPPSNYVPIPGHPNVPPPPPPSNYVPIPGHPNVPPPPPPSNYVPIPGHPNVPPPPPPSNYVPIPGHPNVPPPPRLSKSIKYVPIAKIPPNTHMIR